MKWPKHFWCFIWKVVPSEDCSTFPCSVSRGIQGHTALQKYSSWDKGNTCVKKKKIVNSNLCGKYLIQICKLSFFFFFSLNFLLVVKSSLHFAVYFDTGFGSSQLAYWLCTHSFSLGHHHTSSSCGAREMLAAWLNSLQQQHQGSFFSLQNHYVTEYKMKQPKFCNQGCLSIDRPA